MLTVSGINFNQKASTNKQLRKQPFTSTYSEVVEVIKEDVMSKDVQKRLFALKGIAILPDESFDTKLINKTSDILKKTMVNFKTYLEKIKTSENIQPKAFSESKRTEIKGVLSNSSKFTYVEHFNDEKEAAENILKFDVLSNCQEAIENTDNQGVYAYIFRKAVDGIRAFQRTIGASDDYHLVNRAQLQGKTNNLGDIHT